MTGTCIPVRHPGRYPVPRRVSIDFVAASEPATGVVGRVPRTTVRGSWLFQNPPREWWDRVPRTTVRGSDERLNLRISACAFLKKHPQGGGDGAMREAEAAFY